MYSYFGDTTTLCPMRILSGIQPSGALHLGNYFGMMKPASNCRTGRGVLFHRELSLDDVALRAEPRRKNTLDVALDFLACGSIR